MLSTAVPSKTPCLNGELAKLLSDRAGEWFAPPTQKCSPTSACVLNRTQRRVSTFYRIQVTTGEDQHYVLAKQYRDWLQRPPPPRLFALSNIDDKAPFEYATLTAIHEHFNRFADRRFSTVRPLGVLPEVRTIIMEEFRSDSLSRLLKRCHRLAGVDKLSALKTAFRRAGAWLRRFHALSPLSHTRTRHIERAEFLDSVCCVASHLSNTIGSHECLHSVTQRVSAVALAALPSDLPRGLGHTDFAPRNVLVDARGSVAVIDTLGRWQVPVYEDIGYFFVALQTGALQMYSQGLWHPGTLLEGFENAFLDGYFESAAPPRRAVRLFEVQSLLYRWLALAHNSYKATGVQGLAKRCQLVAHNRILLHHLNRLIEQLAQ